METDTDMGTEIRQKIVVTTEEYKTSLDIEATKKDAENQAQENDYVFDYIHVGADKVLRELIATDDKSLFEYWVCNTPFLNVYVNSVRCIHAKKSTNFELFIRPIHLYDVLNVMIGNIFVLREYITSEVGILMDTFSSSAVEVVEMNDDRQKEGYKEPTNEERLEQVKKIVDGLDIFISKIFHSFHIKIFGVVNDYNKFFLDVSKITTKALECIFMENIVTRWVNCFEMLVLKLTQAFTLVKSCFYDNRRDVIYKEMGTFIDNLDKVQFEEDMMFAESTLFSRVKYLPYDLYTNDMIATYENFESKFRDIRNRAAIDQNNNSGMRMDDALTHSQRKRQRE